jgi:hypothetical protein
MLEQKKLTEIIRDNAKHTQNVKTTAAPFARTGPFFSRSRKVRTSRTTGTLGNLQFSPHLQESQSADSTRPPQVPQANHRSGANSTITYG